MKTRVVGSSLLACMHKEYRIMFAAGHTELNVIGEKSLCSCRRAVSMCDSKPTTGLSHLVGVIAYDDRCCVQHTTYAKHRVVCTHKIWKM